MRDHLLGFPSLVPFLAEVVEDADEIVSWLYQQPHPLGEPTNRPDTPAEIHYRTLRERARVALEEVQAFERGNRKLPDGTVERIPFNPTDREARLIASLIAQRLEASDGKRLIHQTKNLAAALAELGRRVDAEMAEAEKRTPSFFGDGYTIKLQAKG